MTFSLYNFLSKINCKKLIKLKYQLFTLKSLRKQYDMVSKLYNYLPLGKKNESKLCNYLPLEKSETEKKIFKKKPQQFQRHGVISPLKNTATTLF